MFFLFIYFFYFWQSSEKELAISSQKDHSAPTTLEFTVLKFHLSVSFKTYHRGNVCRQNDQKIGSIKNNTLYLQGNCRRRSAKYGLKVLFKAEARPNVIRAASKP